MKQVEAVRATGASFLVGADHAACCRRCCSRFIGFATYQLDSNLRNSTMVGIVGGGGIGGDAVRRLPALRLRLRADHPDRDHRADRDAGRDRLRLHAAGCSNERAADASPDGPAGADAAPLAALHARRAASARSAFYLVVVVAIVWSLRTIEIIPEFLYDAPEQIADLFARMWPIDWALVPRRSCTRR